MYATVEENNNNILTIDIYMYIITRFKLHIILCFDNFEVAVTLQGVKNYSEKNLWLPQI